MASQTITADFTSQIFVPNDNDILLILNNVVGVVEGACVNASGAADGREIEIRGQLTSKAGFDCVLLGASGNPAGSNGGSITIGAAANLKSNGGAAIAAFAEDLAITNLGELAGKFGIRTDNADGFIENIGDIVAKKHCILSEGEDLDILNSGLLKSQNDAAVVLTGNGNVFVNQGIIRGPDDGASIRIDSLDGDANTISIQGRLFSDDIAIQGGDGVDRIDINPAGIVKGDIVLGKGEDEFTFRGALDGVVRGGQGNDLYDIGKFDVKIVETANGGNEDFITATVDTVLPDFVEGAIFFGTKNVDITGNSLDNIIEGNRGVNVLRGLGGDDRMFSDSGNDKIFLGKGNDTFQLTEGDGRDTLMDFVPGTDKINLQSLGLSQGTIIQLLLFDVEGGCELRIEEDVIFFKGLVSDDLSQSDFLI
jgi:Ca2+-binding RTX toxin-like protein